MNSSSNLVLIGFMGSGKSTIGRILAKETGRFFIDSDALIEALEGKPISRIFQEEGELYFRHLEKHCLEWMQDSLQNAVIATGGGMPIHLPSIAKLGRLVYLSCRFETLRSRIKSDAGSERPLGGEGAKELFNERLPRYRALAECVVDADAPAEEVARAILREFAN